MLLTYRNQPYLSLRHLWWDQGECDSWEVKTWSLQHRRLTSWRCNDFWPNLWLQMKLNATVPKGVRSWTIMDLLMRTVIGTTSYKHSSTCFDMKTFFKHILTQVAKTTRFLEQRIQSMPTRMGTTLRLGKSWHGETFSEHFRTVFQCFFFSKECLIFEIFDIIWRFDVHWSRASVRCRFQK